MNRKLLIGLSLTVIVAMVGIVTYFVILNPQGQKEVWLELTRDTLSWDTVHETESIETAYLPFRVGQGETWILNIQLLWNYPESMEEMTVFAYKGYWNKGKDNICTSKQLENDAELLKATEEGLVEVVDTLTPNENSIQFKITEKGSYTYFVVLPYHYDSDLVRQVGLLITLNQST